MTSHRTAHGTHPLQRLDGLLQVHNVFLVDFRDSQQVLGGNGEPAHDGEQLHGQRHGVHTRCVWMGET